MASFSIKDIEDQLKTLNHSQTDLSDRDPFNTVFGLRMTGERTVEIESNFRYNLASADFTVPSGNTGVTGVSDGLGFADSNGLTGTTVVEDTDSLRYRAGTEGGFIFTAAFPTTDTDATQRIGGFNANNGMFVGHNGSNPFVGRRRGGTDTTVELADEDWSGLNIFKLSYGYLGAAPLTYEILRDDGWELLHEFTFFNSPTTNFIVPDVPLRLEVVADADVNARVESGSWMAYTLAQPGTDPQLRSFTRKNIRDTLDTATQEHILTVQNKTQYQGSSNAIRFLPTSARFSVSANEYIEVFVVKNATTQTARTYTDVNTENSVTEVSRDAVTVTDYEKLLYTQVVPGTGTTNQLSIEKRDAEVFNENIAPGDSITAFATTAGSPTLYSTVFEWVEQF